MPLEILAQRQVWVERLGDDDDGYAAQPDLYIHCALGQHETLLPLAKAIGPPALLFDLPGHGRSADWTEAEDYQTVCADIAACAIQSEGPAHVIGHSFGATVALRLAIDRPECVRRLTLIEPVFFAAATGTPAFAADNAFNTQLDAAFQSGDMRHAAELFQGEWGMGRWDQLKRAQRDAMIARMHLVAAGAPAIIDDNAGLLQAGALEGLTQDVTFIRGANSAPIIAEIHAQMMAVMPKAKEHVIAGAGHMCPITHERDVAAIVNAETQLGLDQLQKLIHARFGH